MLHPFFDELKKINKTKNLEKSEELKVLKHERYVMKISHIEDKNKRNRIIKTINK